MKLLKGFELRALRDLETAGVQFAAEGVVSASAWDEVSSLGEGEPAPDSTELQDDPPPLQSKIVSKEQVRRELGKWRGSMGEEVESWVQ